MNANRWKHFSSLFLAIILASGGCILTGCNTTEGFGEDVENLGESISDEAQEAN